MQIVESIKFEGKNLTEMFANECVKSISKTDNGNIIVYLKGEYTYGRSFMRKGEYLCRFESGLWQVFGAEAYDRLNKNGKNK